MIESKKISSKIVFSLCAVIVLCLATGFIARPDWGFFAHKRINRLAALTLPPKMIVFYKKHIEYITEHAVDPDARRYIVKGEGPKHFLDLDHYGTFPFPDVPRLASDARLYYTRVYGINAKGDTVQILGHPAFQCKLKPNGAIDSLFLAGSGQRPQISPIDLRKYRSLFYDQIMPYIIDDAAILRTDSMNQALVAMGLDGNWQQIYVQGDSYGEHGALPWNLQTYFDRLKKAFTEQNAEMILKTSADLGHYVGDAQVPLHTVSNYNGQKTGQEGIHGFWESRIPELFADEEYDYYVGAPEYISNMDSFIWTMVLESHRYADTVLSNELMLRKTFPANQQICADIRAGKQILTQCRNYAKAYENTMGGLVERRMRDAIHNLSSIWYTAWFDAGQPDLSALANWSPSESEKAEWKKLLEATTTGKMIGRGED